MAGWWVGPAGGVPVPVNALIYDCLRPQDLQARDELVFARPGL